MRIMFECKKCERKFISYAKKPENVWCPFCHGDELSELIREAE